MGVISVMGVIAGLGWVALLLVPWQPWRSLEKLEADPQAPRSDLTCVTVLIPARNEAEQLPVTLRALANQGTGLRVVVVDDESTDETAERARTVEGIDVTVVSGRPLPAGWTGKLWALEQGRQHVCTDHVLLLDADIILASGTIAALIDKSRREQLDLVSLMATLRMQGFWEKLLCPAFVYFFKLLYPFRLANRPSSRVAAAAGGCMLIRSAALDSMGGFGSIREALIDDCTLAARLKRQGHAIWIGLSRSVCSYRQYNLSEFWNMVARTAFTQLRYSVPLLCLITALMGFFFWVPWIGLIEPGASRFFALGGLAATTLAYLPTLRFYCRSSAWALALPLVATLFLLMTWSSAIRYWRGQRSAWKDRAYPRTA